MRNVRSFAVVGGVAVAVAVLLLRRGGEAADPAVPDVPVVAAPSAAPSPATGQVGAPAPQAVGATTDRSRELLLPDGSYVPALNGATDPAPLKQFWGLVPWSPIVGVETNDHGVAWYRHANGSYSTTETLWDSAGKRHVTLTRVAHQGPAETPALAPKR